MAAELHPAARELLRGLGRIGYKAISSAVKTGLGEIRQVGETVLARVRDGEAAAERMSRGEPYRREADAEEEEYFR